MLAPFLGLHCVSLRGATKGRKVYFVIMRSVFDTEREIHERFDLKVNITLLQHSILFSFFFFQIFFFYVWINESREAQLEGKSLKLNVFCLMQYKKILIGCLQEER